MDTVEGILREMRNVERISHSANTKWFADRLDAAYKRDMKAMCDAGEIDMRTAMGEVERLRQENARLMSAIVRVHGCLDSTCGSMGVCRTCELMRLGGAE